MKIKKTSVYSQGLIAVITIFSISLIALAVTFTVSSETLGQLLRQQNESSAVTTFYTSESAVLEGAYQVVEVGTTFTSATLPNINNVLSNTVFLTPLSYPKIQLSSSAYDDLTTRNHQVNMTLFPEAGSFDHAVYSQSSLEIGGNTEINGNVYADGDIDFNGSSADVNGDALASGNVDTSSGNVNGVAASSVDSTTVIDIDPTQYIATSTLDGTYFSNPADAEAFVNGNTKHNVFVYVAGASNSTHFTSNNTHLSGTVIIEGDLSLKNAEIHVGSHDPYNEPLVIYVGGDLSLSGNAEIEGIVYVKGGTTFSGGSNTIDGSLISFSDVNTLNVTGNVTITYDPTLAADWQEISGIDTSTGSPPKVIQWSEY